MGGICLVQHSFHPSLSWAGGLEWLGAACQVVTTLSYASKVSVMQHSWLSPIISGILLDSISSQQGGFQRLSSLYIYYLLRGLLAYQYSEKFPLCFKT